MKLRRLLSVLCVLSASWHAAGAQSGPAPVPEASEARPAWSAEERDVIETLRGLRKKQRPSDAELADRLGRHGERVLGLFFEILRARSVPALEEGEPQVLSEVQERAILGGIAQLERAAVLAEVQTALAAERDLRRRHAALGCVGAVARANDLLQLFGLALEPQETALDERLAKALRAAVASLLAHDPRGFEQLVSLRRLTRPELVPSLVAAVGAAGDPRGLAYLSEVVYWNEGLILDVMSQIPLLGPSGDETIDAPLKVRLRPYLDESKPGPCRAAITALTALHDEEALSGLIPLLASESGGMRENAHWALKQLTGLNLGPSADVWGRWHQSEQFWLLRSKPKEFQRLRDNDAAVVTDALRTILTHPLARRELVTALPDLLQSHWPALRVLACRTLADLDAHEAVGRLVWALEDRDADVARAAHEALRALTRFDLPREPLAWQQATNTEPRASRL